MSNMSYCRFQNTLLDLRDCEEHFDDEDLSSDELSARARLWRVCNDIANNHDLEDLEDAAIAARDKGNRR